MKTLEHGLLADLVAERAGPCVSLYAPTGPWDADGRQIRIRWRNLLRRAKRLLEQAGRPPGEADAILEPATVLDPVRVGKGRSVEGLAAFVSAGFFRAQPLSVEPEEEAAVGPHFHLRPLLRSLTAEPIFHVLALSQNEVRLLEATARRTTVIDLPGCPASLADALRYDEHEQSLQFHAGISAPGGRPSALYHGQGGSVDPHKDEILRFSRQVDSHVCRALHGARSPVVLACVDYLFPIYREASALPTLAAGFVRGSPDRVRDEELAERAREIVKDEAFRATEADGARFRALAGTGRTVGSLGEVLQAARQGRVDRMFLAADTHGFGTFDPQSGRVHLARDGRPGARDLLDEAAVEVLSHGGSVRVVARQEMPAADMAAAILRY